MATVTSSKDSTKCSPIVFCSFLFHAFKESNKRLGMPGRRGRTQFSNLGGESMKQAFCKNSILALLVLQVATLGAFAQSLERGAVRGFVYDASGAAIVGAKVSITNPSTGLKREVSTDADGGYTFEALNPGEFNLVVEAPGFATYNVKQIVVNVGASLGLDIHMKVKTAEQSIEVTAE